MDYDDWLEEYGEEVFTKWIETLDLSSVPEDLLMEEYTSFNASYSDYLYEQEKDRQLEAYIDEMHELQREQASKK